MLIFAQENVYHAVTEEEVAEAQRDACNEVFQGIRDTVEKVLMCSTSD